MSFRKVRDRIRAVLMKIYDKNRDGKGARHIVQMKILNCSV